MSEKTFAEDGNPPSRNDRSGAQLSGEDADLITSLEEIHHLTVGKLPLRAMLTKVAHNAVLAVPGAEGAGLTLIAEDRSETLVSTAQFVTDVDAIQYGIRQGPCITAATDGVTVLSHSLGDDKRWPQFGAQVAGLGVHSALSLPLILRDQVIGAMNIYARGRNAFDARSAELGQQFAAPAAIAVQNGQILDRARELAAQLQTALATRALIDRAIGVLIDSDGISEEEAERRLRSAGGGERRIVRELAEDILRKAELRNQLRRSPEPKR